MWLVCYVMMQASPEWQMGFDISHLEGEVDWVNVDIGGHSFCFVKSTEGDDFVDPMAAENMKQARDKGLKVGAYHFYRNNDEPDVQANNFIANSPLLPGDLAPVVDVETMSHEPHKDWLDDLRTFVSILESHYGVKPIIYTSPRFWNTHGSDEFGDLLLWVAEYGVEQPLIPQGFEQWTFWQHTEDTPMKGVPKPVDLNYFVGGSLERLTIPTSQD